MIRFFERKDHGSSDKNDFMWHCFNRKSVEVRQFAFEKKELAGLILF